MGGGVQKIFGKTINSGKWPDIVAVTFIDMGNLEILWIEKILSINVLLESLNLVGCV